MGSPDVNPSAQPQMCQVVLPERVCGIALHRSGGRRSFSVSNCWAVLRARSRVQGRPTPGATRICHVSDQAAPGVPLRAPSAVWQSKCCCGCRLCRVCDCAANRLMVLSMLAKQVSRLWSFQRTVHAEHIICRI